ncbi:hypothetical protein CLHOM_06270 [Clostridium homopropionicum DSM 5847]|uniref:Spore protein YkvP/CgeB glycosyl transferase-like domain-containing protein n=1 Tax=Clostridium homopropionicum DSM 5847 TaxID=1121318 RepID=A0A0L6ZDI1_9CLOT|nr:glycosyltransferase [Clostridium homopropionicum]KOA21039.1 hypothetical protein CLHOM_06270 [Clostridium homopropionicum DSM 5847]SFF98776.1 Glycosyltransferase involved in cell wall bisynthesis [Clostridium homopropionicum]
MDQDINKIKSDIKENIKILVDNGNLTEAKTLTNEYKKINPRDIEIYSIDAVISIMEGNLETAENILFNGLKIDHNNFDLLYNLGFLYERLGNDFQAIINYKKALFYVENEDTKNELIKIIDNIEYKEYSEDIKNKIRTYKSQVEEYARRQMLNPNVVLNPDDFIKKRKVEIKQNIKILYGSIEIANHIHSYSQKLQSMGYQAFSLNYYPNYLDYKVDFTFDVKNPKNNGIAKEKIIQIAAMMIAEFDVFHFFFNTSLTLNYSDLIILKMLNKKVVMHNVGSDVRMYSKAIGVNPYWGLLSDSYFKRLDEDITVKKIRYISKHISNCIVADYELNEYVKEYYPNIHFVKIPIDLEQYKDTSNNNGKNSRLLIVHAPTNPEVKGTKYILDAIEELKKIYEFDFKLIKGVSHEEAKEIYRRSDIVIDQVIHGYGGLAVECMAMNKVVISNICDFMKKGYPDDLPVVIANTNNIKEVVEKLIKDKELREKIGSRGREYVKKYHDVNIIVKQFLKIYDNIENKKM